MKPLVAYFRVSTEKQGRSGLGLDAQRAAVRAHAERSGGKILAEYTEVESGAKNDRPELARAVARARACKGTLVVAKLDRLARDVRLILALVDSGVGVHFCDLPDFAGDDPAVGRLMLTLLAAVAEFERKRIQQRVKAALAQCKRRGIKLGAANPQGGRGFLLNGKQKQGTKAASIARSKKAAEFRAMMRPVVEELQQQGHQTLAQLALALNASGYQSRTGKPWTEQRVHAILHG